MIRSNKIRTAGIKRDKYDEVFSELVRERADWCCEYCGRCFRHDPHSLHCSHIFGRARKSVRVHPMNAMALCHRDHEFLGQHPLEHAEFVKRRLGERDYQRLLVLAGRPTKFSKDEREIIHAHYLKEKRRIGELRRSGAIGRIDFTLP